jgi:hypothetical protein
MRLCLARLLCRSLDTRLMRYTESNGYVAWLVPDARANR